MSFTPRETADSLFTSAHSTGTSRVFGVNTETMRDIVAHRLAHIDAAIVAIDKAIGTPRILLREPDDAKLAQMRTVLESRRERIAEILAGKS